MTLTGPEVRILEIHPASLTRLMSRCSSESEGEGVGTQLLLQAVSDAAGLGYNFLHIGGNAPLACPAMHTLCRRARHEGMLTTITVGPSWITQPLIDELRGSIDLLGVAMEGRPAVHGRTRSCRQLRLLEAAGMDFGVVFTLTRGNLGDLQWAVRYAIDHDARMLTIRTADLLPRQLSTAWMVVECMRKLYRERLTIQFEDVNRYNLPREAFQLDQWHMELAQQPRGLSRVVSRLVIEADGMVVPLQPGFPRPLALGNLRERGLAEMARLWIATRAEDFCRVYQATLVAAEPGEGPLTELVQFAAAG